MVFLILRQMLHTVLTYVVMVSLHSESSVNLYRVIQSFVMKVKDIDPEIVGRRKCK
jgi:hypothetical protein